MSHDVNRQAQRQRERERERGDRLKEPAGRTEVHATGQNATNSGICFYLYLFYLFFINYVLVCAVLSKHLR